MPFNIRTKQGARRCYNALLRQYFSDFSGGGAFGWDWRTMRLNVPETYDTLRWLQSIYACLPSRKVRV